MDIIAWRHFNDRYAATFLMFVQVASGLDWKEKEVASDVKSIRKWFKGTSFEHFLPAICIPFPLWFDLDEPPVDEVGKTLAFKDGVLVRFAYREAKFGIIFDRGRIARSCAAALSDAISTPNQIDGLDRIAEIVAWVAEAVSHLKEIRAA